MTDDQDLAYRRMLDASWELGPLPSSVDHLAMIVRYDLERFRRAWRYPLSSCWKKNGHGTVINQRLEDERDAMLRRSEKAKQAVHQRELNRSKRLGTKGNEPYQPIIDRSSDDEPAINDPKPKPKPKPGKERVPGASAGMRKRRTPKPKEFFFGEDGSLHAKGKGPVERLEALYPDLDIRQILHELSEWHREKRCYRNADSFVRRNLAKAAREHGIEKRIAAKQGRNQSEPKGFNAIKSYIEEHGDTD